MIFDDTTILSAFIIPAMAMIFGAFEAKRKDGRLWPCLVMVAVSVVVIVAGWRSLGS